MIIARKGFGRIAASLMVAAWGTGTWGQGQTVTMTIDAGKIGAPINPHLYGQFSELLRNMYEKGIWSEMISDRKFFYPVDNSQTLTPPNSKTNFNRWRPVGPENAVTMDKRAYAGKQAPQVALAGAEVRGITQTGLVVRSGKQYTGRIMLAGSPGAKVEVTLTWGEGADQRQTVVMPILSEEYMKIPLKFTTGANTDKATLTITGTGTGAFRVGAVSLMPADNVKGFRADMVALLRDLDTGIWRWPGGNFVSGYDWRDGIGDPDKRPAKYDYAWNTVEYNDVGLDEFMTLCGLLKIDPYLCVNAGLGDDRSAAEEVEYANGAGATSMGKWRAANGHPQPYGVKMWNIGNEVYGEWQLGHLYVDQYVLKHNAFAEAMRAVDPGITLIASGATPFETSTTSRHHRKPLPATLPYQYGSKQDWSFVLLEKCSDHMDMLAEHLYPVFDSAFDVEKQAFVQTDDPLIDRVRRTPNRIKGAVEAMEEYRRRLPGLKEKNIPYAIDEWAVGNGFQGTLAAAEGLHEMFRHTDMISMAAFTGFTRLIAQNGAESCNSSTGLLFGMYRQHFGTIPVAVTGNSPQHEVKGTVGVDKPVVSSGSDTYPLDVAAALSGGAADRKVLTVAVANPAETAQRIGVKFLSVTLQNGGKKWVIAAPNLQAQNLPGQEAQVKTVESAVERVPEQLEVPPLSVTIYEFRVN